MRPPTTARALRHSFLLLLVAALLTGGGRMAGAAAGGKFAPAGGGFAVSFPGTPQRTSRKQGYDSMVLHMSNYGLNHEGVGYFVAWVGDMPAAAMQEPMVEEIFYSRMEQNLILSAKLSGKTDLAVAARANLSLDGFTGRQYVFNSATDIGVLRAYKAGLRFYAVGVFGPKDKFAAPQAVAFLESFKLTGKQ